MDGNTCILLCASIQLDFERISLHLRVRLRVSCQQHWLGRFPMDLVPYHTVLDLGIPVGVLVLATESDQITKKDLRLPQETGPSAPEEHDGKRSSEVRSRQRCAKV